VLTSAQPDLLPASHNSAPPPPLTSKLATHTSGGHPRSPAVLGSRMKRAGAAAVCSYSGLSALIQGVSETTESASVEPLRAERTVKVYGAESACQGTRR
jgi:hypothetical protein